MSTIIAALKSVPLLRSYQLIISCQLYRFSRLCPPQDGNGNAKLRQTVSYAALTSIKGG